MKLISVIMTIDNLLEFPMHNLPKGYQIRTFKNFDERYWADIETSAGEFTDTDEAVLRFQKEFGGRKIDLYDRCLFLESKTDGIIGTATAWFSDGLFNDNYGRVHWVGIKKEFQGRKLAKPLLSHTLKKLSEFHTQAYLTTQTTSYKAINMYLNYGFTPFINNEKHVEAWQILYKYLKHPSLIKYQ
ncbi:MAG TPA: GNAT family N-acetyltransferase [Victivallales bacterium]|nr:GNAT family N-acetyltransferase [Victivallales bacterium]